MFYFFYPFHILNFCIVSKIIDVIQEYISATDSVFFTLYVSFNLATTLWCTLFIILRILTVTGVRRGAGSRLRVFQHFIEVLVESSALYSIVLVLYMAFFIRKNFGWYFLDPIAAIMKVRSLSWTPSSFIWNTLCRELPPRSLLAEQRQDIHSQPKNMTQVRRCRPFVSMCLRNLLILRNLPLHAFRNPPCRAQSLKRTSKLSGSSRIRSWWLLKEHNRAHNECLQSWLGALNLLDCNFLLCPVIYLSCLFSFLIIVLPYLLHFLINFRVYKSL